MLKIKSNYCWGDCCGATKKITNEKLKTELYIFKFDCGEYGSGNDEFYFVNGNLVLVRNFSINIKEYPTDTTATLFNVSEKITYLKERQAKVKERTVNINNEKVNTINEINFIESSLNYETAIKAKKDEFSQLLELENSKDE